MSDPKALKNYRRDFDALIIKLEGLLDDLKSEKKKKEDEIKYIKRMSQNRLKINNAVRLITVQGLMDSIEALKSEKKKREDDIKYRKLMFQNRLKILDADAVLCRSKVEELSLEKRILQAKFFVFETLSGGLPIVVDIENWLEDKDSALVSHINQGENLKKELDDIFEDLKVNMKEKYKEEADKLLRLSGVKDIYELLKTELEERVKDDWLLVEDGPLRHAIFKNDHGNFMALRF